MNEQFLKFVLIMASMLPSQPPSPPISLWFQLPDMMCKKDGKILLKTQHQFIL